MQTKIMFAYKLVCFLHQKGNSSGVVISASFISGLAAAACTGLPSTNMAL
jgi:hypothetical protein